MSRDWLDRLERAGNRLPDPATLFLIGTLLIILLSQLAVSAGWSVEKVVEQNGAPVTQTVAAVSLLDSNGLWWIVSHIVENFVSFPPLGLVLVVLIGIGVAERAGLLPTLLRRLMESVSDRLLVPVTIFVGINSSIAPDAGYVVLPPLAGALFAAAGTAATRWLVEPLRY